MSCTVSALYCDDIRIEQGGKTTIVGVYGPHLIVPSFPARLSKFCIYGLLVVPIGTEISGPSTIRILSQTAQSETEKVLSEMPFAFNDIARAGQKDLFPIVGNPKFLRGTFNLIFGGLEFNEPTALRVIALINGEELRTPGISIVAQPAE